MQTTVAAQLYCTITIKTLPRFSSDLLPSNHCTVEWERELGFNLAKHRDDATKVATHRKVLAGRGLVTSRSGRPRPTANYLRIKRLKEPI